MSKGEFSFDVVSRVDMQEVRNAVDQAQKELSNRYDFRGSKSEILFEKDEITLVGDDDFRLDQVRDIFFSKMVKRNVDPRSIDYAKAEPGSGGVLRQKVILKQGIPQDKAKELVKKIKDDKNLKVSAQVQGEEVRISSKSKDDLQKAIQFIKGLELDYATDFVNYR